MTVPHSVSAARGSSPRRYVGLVGLAALLVAGAFLVPASDARLVAADPPVAATEPPGSKRPLFADWPQGQKPDAVIVLSGQTYGYLQPCGCSRPQFGGLERRAVLMNSLRAKGWPVVGVDLGDVYPEKAALAKQGELKYLASMNALREMGYIGVGIGKTDLAGDLYRLIASYALQKEQPPYTLAGNAVGTNSGKVIPREQYFPPPPGATRALVGQTEVAKVGQVPVGVVGVVGNSLALDAKKLKLDETIDFLDVGVTLKAATAELANHPLKPALNVLMYQGDAADAAVVAKAWPQFQVILCRASDSLPPLMPQLPPGGNALIVEVGDKGQHVGVLGAFKKPGGGFDFKYQLVKLGEEYVTPGDEAEARKANKTLVILDDYAKAVKAANLLPKYPRVPHPAQIHAAGLTPPMKLSYVGSAKCQACHVAEFTKLKDVPHSHAMHTLEKVAKRPEMREFDGECVKCHTVGFGYQTGYVDANTTPHLRDVGCENCHGPGSGHVAAPGNKALLAYLSPWKVEGADKLPDLAFMEKMAKTEPFERGKVAIAPAQLQLINKVSQTCSQCHDHENDPHFDLYKYWPKIAHSRPAKK